MRFLRRIPVSTKLSSGSAIYSIHMNIKSHALPPMSKNNISSFCSMLSPLQTCRSTLLNHPLSSVLLLPTVSLLSCCSLIHLCFITHSILPLSFPLTILHLCEPFIHTPWLVIYYSIYIYFFGPWQHALTHCNYLYHSLTSFLSLTFFLPQTGVSMYLLYNKTTVSVSLS